MFTGKNSSISRIFYLTLRSKRQARNFAWISACRQLIIGANRSPSFSLDHMAVTSDDNLYLVLFGGFAELLNHLTIVLEVFDHRVESAKCNKEC